jgi:hypothetical protein
MVVFEVALMHNQSFKGKKVFIEAKDGQEAFAKAKRMQQQPHRWEGIIAKPQCIIKQKFKHKGLANRI